MKQIAIVLFTNFILTAIWKFRESKWIKNFQYVTNRNFDFHQNRDKLHQWGFIFIGLMFGFNSYSWLGLTWKAGIVIAISGTVFWLMDILLNVFLRQTTFYRGKTAKMDKIPFYIRFILLVLLIASLFFIS